MFKGRGWPYLIIFILFFAQNFLAYLTRWSLALVLISVVFYALRQGWRSGFWFGLFAGMLNEIFSQGPLGFAMAQFAALGVLSGFLSSRVFAEGLPTEILLPTLAVYFSALAEIIYRQWMTPEAWRWQDLGAAWRVQDFVLTAVLSPVLFFYLRKISPRIPWRP